MKQIYAGNLPESFKDRDLYDLFSPFGRIESVMMAFDGKTGLTRDFGFLEMYDNDADEAISKLNGKEIKGKKLRIEESKPSIVS